MGCYLPKFLTNLVLSDGFVGFFVVSNCENSLVSSISFLPVFIVNAKEFKLLPSKFYKYNKHSNKKTFVYRDIVIGSCCFFSFLRVVNSLKNASKNYSDVQKLQKDIEEAHIMLASMERDVEHLNSQKVKSQDILERVKTDHKTLQDEKVYLQQQLNIAKKECIGKNKRKIKEVQQLVDEFQKLDQKEKMLRKHVAMIESELFLIISKLETPDQANEKKQKPGHTEAAEPKIWQPTGKPFTSQDELPQVPGLDLAQLNNQIILPPIKNSGPKAPRKGVNTTSVAEKNFTSFNTGYKNTLKMSNSTPSIQNYELILADAKATHEKARHKGHNANKVYGNHQPERLLNRVRE